MPPAPRLGGFAIALLAAVAGLSTGCLPAAPVNQEVVVYAALDREFSEPLLDDFSKSAGIRVLPKYDVEANKTVGLTTSIIAERAAPRCDVFWNNEILHTLRLEQMGLLEAHIPPTADKFPHAFRSPDGRWHGFAARARVLLVNTEQVSRDESPRSLTDLVDPKWRGRCGLARPLFGTTATHAAVLFSSWGEERAREFFRQVAENAEVLPGNKQVALEVASGRLAFGLTDTDDAIIELERGMPVAIVAPDQEPGEIGALLIPNTLCIIRGGPNPLAARRLVDWLLTAEVERRLAAGASAQVPLHEDAERRSRAFEAEVRAMEVDFRAAAAEWDRASEFLRELFSEG